MTQKIDFSLLDRIALTETLPTRDSFMNLSLRRDILNKIQITGKERSKYGIEVTESGIQYKPNKDKFSYPFSESEINYLKQKLRGLSAQGILPDELFEVATQLNIN